MSTLRTIIVSVISLTTITQASALNTRTWVSGKGTDAAGCGPIASPCRTLQFAHDQTSPGGEIDVLDPAGYGSIIITKAINIMNGGGIAGVLASAGGNAITITAGYSDAVVLRGLTVEGAGVGGNGIVFNSGGALTIANCVVQGFAKTTGTTGYGIWIKHTSGSPKVTITETTASYNDAIGIVVSPSVNGGGYYAVSRTTVSHNGYGLSVYTADTTGEFRVSVTRSEALNNKGFGFQFWGYPSLTPPTNYFSATLSHSSAHGNSPGISIGNYVLLDVTDVVAAQNLGVDFVGNGDNAFLQGDGTNRGSKITVHSQTTTRF